MQSMAWSSIDVHFVWGRFLSVKCQKLAKALSKIHAINDRWWSGRYLTVSVGGLPKILSSNICKLRYNCQPDQIICLCITSQNFPSNVVEAIPRNASETKFLQSGFRHWNSKNSKISKKLRLPVKVSSWFHLQSNFHVGFRWVSANIGLPCGNSLRITINLWTAAAGSTLQHKIRDQGCFRGCFPRKKFRRSEMTRSGATQIHCQTEKLWRHSWSRVEVNRSLCLYHVHAEP